MTWPVRKSRGARVLLPLLRPVVFCLLVAAWASPMPRASAAPAPAAVILSSADPTVGWTRWWDTPVYAAPSLQADLITRLDRNQRLAVRGQQRDAAGTWWTRILVWNTFDGWIPAHFVAPRPTGPSPWTGVP